MSLCNAECNTKAVIKSSSPARYWWGWYSEKRGKSGRVCGFPRTGWSGASPAGPGVSPPLMSHSQSLTARPLLLLQWLAHFALHIIDWYTGSFVAEHYQSRYRISRAWASYALVWMDTLRYARLAAKSSSPWPTHSVSRSPLQHLELDQTSESQGPPDASAAVASESRQIAANRPCDDLHQCLQPAPFIVCLRRPAATLRATPSRWSPDLQPNPHETACAHTGQNDWHLECCRDN